MRGVLTAAVTLATVGFALPLHAQQTPNQLLREGIAAYDALDYDEALRKLSAALLGSSNTADDNRAIYQYLGLSYLLLDKPEQATGAFRNMLALAPDYHFDAATAPRIVEFFENVRRQWEADGRPGIRALPPAGPRPVRIVHAAPEQAVAGRDLSLRVSLVNGDGRGRLLLRYRSGGRGLFQAVPVVADRPAVIPAAAVRPGTVEYYFEAVDATGALLATRGDPDAPLRVLVPDSGGGGSVLGKWWFWTGAVAVVGGGVALAVILSSNGGSGHTTPPDDRATVLVNIVPASE
jgi:tetratricopeptide (TPR) repeat protein